MSSVVTIMNMKGGVGKTVISAHLGGMLARYKFANAMRRVLLIDYDPQFNLSQTFIPAKTYFSLEKDRKTSRAILQDDETNIDPFKLQVPGNHTPPKVSAIAHHVYTRLHLVPSTLDLMYLALGQLPARTDVFEERFAKFILECRSQYDAIIIDCHPAGSLLTKTSLHNSDHVIIPVVPTSAYAARGVALVKRFIDDLAPAKKPQAHIIFNQWKQTSASELDIRNDPRHKQDCVASVLHHRKAFSDGAEGQGFVWNSSRPYSTRAFANLNAVVNELVGRLKL